MHLVRDQGGLAGNAFPFGVLIEPDVGKAAASREGFAVFNPFVPIDARAHRHVVAVKVHSHAFVVDLFPGDSVRSDPCFAPPGPNFPGYEAVSGKF